MIKKCIVYGMILVASITSFNSINAMANEKVLYNLNVNTDEKKFDVSDTLTGLFFEDINHGADGGLYSDLVENNSFEFKDSMESWEVQGKGGDLVEVKNEESLNNNNKNYIEFNLNENSNAKIINDGYKGITVKNNDSYDFYFWAKGNCINPEIKLYIEDDRGNIISNVRTVNNIGSTWNKYEGELSVTSDCSQGKLIVEVTGNGKIDMDMISIFTQDTWNDRKYGLRKDLVQRIADLEPKFIRFPGGCVVEGHNKDQMYNWKNTIGPIEERVQSENLWGYYQSYGLGFYEYFQLCEDLNSEPLPVVNSGMSCQGGIHGGKSEYMAEIGEELDTYIQDALDLIEYANGDENTTWGKKRIESGHKEPFNLKYLAIGNEQWGEEYHKRFEEFQKVINEKYPNITLISAAGPVADGVILNEAWDWINEKAKNTIVDEHYYMSPDWFFNNTDRYDTYDRNGAKVFLGEYASQSNTLRSALSEAAYFTGLEKNSDVVKMSSYAPLFAKYDDFQWSPDMIWFNGSTNYVTPNYFVQKLFGTNVGSQMLNDEFIDNSVKEEKIIEGGAVLGAWSTKVEYDNLKVTDNKTGEIIYYDDFTSNNDKLDNISGNWKIENGKLVMDEIKDDCRIQTSDNDWSNYTLEVDAKKLGGNEGFLVGFGAKDTNNYYWLNIGGWGNTSTAVEKSLEGVKSTIVTADKKYGTVEDNKNYKIKIVVDGSNISCYMDDVLIAEVKDDLSQKDIFTSSSYDEETNELIIKVVNASEENQKVNINILGKNDVESTAKVEYITGESLMDSNSFEEPEKIKIQTKNIYDISKNFLYDADKYSASVIRIQLVE